MAREIVRLPEGFIALNKELASGYHTSLETKLSNHGGADWEIRLAEIAAHCSVALDAIYTPEDLDKLCFILAGRLEVLREVAPPQVIRDLH